MTFKDLKSALDALSCVGLADDTPVILCEGESADCDLHSVKLQYTNSILQPLELVLISR